MTTILTLAAGDLDPTVATDRGVSLVPAHDRADHAPDRHLALLDGSSLLARCSCWWTAAPQRLGERFGVIGHYAAATQAAGAILLDRACETLAAAGCTVAAGPMDGNTWRRYRFVTERGDAPPFFLEPDNPDDWPAHWTSAGFTPLATYTSALNDNLATAVDRSEAARERLADAGIIVTTLDPGRAQEELRRIYALSLLAFSRNFLYTPIAEAEFLAQYGAVLPVVRPELVLLAERDHDLVGFIFAIPDMLQAYRGEIVDTVILKTMAVHPSVSGMGLGGLLMDDVQRAARDLGFRRAIHALMHEDNTSRALSTRYARTFRRYTLFSRPLQAPTHPD
jgi:GNAT superfamily N-acetyltransferase